MYRMTVIIGKISPDRVNRTPMQRGGGLIRPDGAYLCRYPLLTSLLVFYHPHLEEVHVNTLQPQLYLIPPTLEEEYRLQPWCNLGCTFTVCGCENISVDPAKCFTNVIDRFEYYSSIMTKIMNTYR